MRVLCDIIREGSGKISCGKNRRCRFFDIRAAKFLREGGLGCLLSLVARGACPLFVGKVLVHRPAWHSICSKIVF